MKGLPAHLSLRSSRRGNRPRRRTRRSMSASSLCGAVALALIATLLPAPLLPDSVPPARAQNTSSSSSSTEGYQTETAETTRNPDGSYTTEIHSAPVQYEDSSGNWRNIDSTLVETNEDGFDYTNKANSFDVLLSEQSANDYMRVEVHGLAFDFRLEGAEGAAAEPRGSRLVYPDALDGVDLRDDADSQGVKETLVLHDSSAPSDYRFVMTPPPDQEVEAQENPDGSWAFFVDSMVEPVFVLETPTVYDSADSGRSAPGPKHTPAWTSPTWGTALPSTSAWTARGLRIPRASFPSFSTRPSPSRRARPRRPRT